LRRISPASADEHAIGVGSGTEALWLSLLALGVGQGDEVITVPNTFIATAEAISFCGATPVFVDVDERTYNMDPHKLEWYLKSSTRHSTLGTRPKAVIPVHLFGQPADMDPIMEIAGKYGLFVIEDACQAHGAGYKGRRAGSVGDGLLQLLPGKNLGAYGEAGAVVTNNTSWQGRLRCFAIMDSRQNIIMDLIGWNGRMDEPGCCACVKLKHLEAWNEAEEKMPNFIMCSPIQTVS
jgi:dTDP-4-amino-4,6-dideoxygalactose transaminase